MPTGGNENTKVDRRLAAILAADIAGYSALMGSDEARTVRDLKGHQAVMLPMIASFGGRVIDTAGDGILAEFASVVNAVECALAIQKTMLERNASVDPGRRMQFRIGVNQGDVVYDEARIYGDGINVAARLESIADTGGICLSGKVYEEIQGRIDLACEDMGPQEAQEHCAARSGLSDRSPRVSRHQAAGRAVTGQDAGGIVRRPVDCCAAIRKHEWRR